MQVLLEWDSIFIKPLYSCLSIAHWIDQKIVLASTTSTLQFGIGLIQ